VSELTVAELDVLITRTQDAIKRASQVDRAALVVQAEDLIAQRRAAKDREQPEEDHVVRWASPSR
jgi:hypothetical protein